MSNDPNAPAPTEDELAFWDVMDEEYESNMILFEDEVAHLTSTDRPEAPPADFWLKEILRMPLSPAQAYYDPEPLDTLTSRYAAQIESILLDHTSRSDHKSYADVVLARADLLDTFNRLEPRLRQQAFRLTKDGAVIHLDPKAQEGVAKYYEFASVLDTFSHVLKTDHAAKRAAIITAYLQTREDRQRTLLAELRGRKERGGPPTQLMFATVHSLPLGEMGSRILREDLQPYHAAPSAAAGLLATTPRPPFSPAPKTKGQDLAKRMEREKIRRGFDDPHKGLKFTK